MVDVQHWCEPGISRIQARNVSVLASFVAARVSTPFVSKKQSVSDCLCSYISIRVFLTKLSACLLSWQDYPSLCVSLSVPSCICVLNNSIRVF
jgi:hypothetical protein